MPTLFDDLDAELLARAESQGWIRVRQFGREFWEHPTTGQLLTEEHLLERMREETKDESR